MAIKDKVKNAPALRFSEFKIKWDSEKLADGIELISGLHLSTEDYNNNGEGIPYFTGPSDFTDSPERITKWTQNLNNSAKQNDVLITVKGSGVGTMAILNFSQIAIGRQLMSIRGKTYDSHFVFQTLLSKSNIFNILASGNLIPGLSRPDILKLKVNIPSQQEQQKIASFLSSVDEKIRQLTRKKELLDQYKKGVMQQLFSGKLRFKDENGKNYPEWEEKRLGEVCDYKNGGSFESSVCDEGLYNLISLNSIDINGKLKPEHKKVSENDNSLTKGDLVMVLSDVAHGYFLGLTDIIPTDNYVLNQRMGALKPKIKIERYYLKTAINFSQRYFKLMGQGSSQKNLSKNDVLDFKIELPTIEEQHQISRYLSSIDTKIEMVTTQIIETQTFKKGLLQQMFV
jgi:type I restriction enzyme S subunit